MPWTDAGADRPEDPPGSHRTASTPAGDVLLARLPEGWVAVADACTHAGCPFSTDGSVEETVVVCDCHGSEFDLRTGAVLRGPAREPVAVYPVRVRDGRLEVET